MSYGSCKNYKYHMSEYCQVFNLPESPMSVTYEMSHFAICQLCFGEDTPTVDRRPAVCDYSHLDSLRKLSCSLQTTHLFGQSTTHDVFPPPSKQQSNEKCRISPFTNCLSPLVPPVPMNSLYIDSTTSIYTKNKHMQPI